MGPEIVVIYRILSGDVRPGLETGLSRTGDGGNQARERLAQVGERNENYYSSM